MFDTSEMLKVFAKYRGDAIVVSGRGGKHWINISDTALDIPLGDPAMGGHCGFAFGLAMALPQRRVVLFDSEGDLQMSLGVLLTVAEQKPANFYHFMLDNECYATTGGQPVPNAKNVKYDQMALGAGYPRAFAFDQLDAFSKALPDILEKPGPVFVAMKVKPEVENEAIGNRRKWRTRSQPQVVADLKKALQIA
jgi:thiamine pyrophosphate-dependent acetolactate synthase large subunit-like protein